MFISFRDKGEEGGIKGRKDEVIFSGIFHHLPNILFNDVSTILEEIRCESI